MNTFNTWNDSRVEACATARIIGIRSRAIADLAGQITKIDDPNNLIAQDWEFLIAAFRKLSGELEAEIANFSEQARYWEK